MEIKIDSEFRDLIPALSPMEVELLEESIKQEGLRDPIITWQGLVIDGHNRIRICFKNGIPIKTKEKEFPDREAAKEWIIMTQLSRRNLTPRQAKLLRGDLYNRIKNNRGGDQTILAKGQFDPLLNTADRLAKNYGVSAKTIKRDGRLAQCYCKIKNMVSGDMEIEEIINKLPEKKIIELAENCATFEDVQGSLGTITNVSSYKPTGISIDPERITLLNEDYLEADIPPKINAVITEPPFLETGIKEYLTIVEEIAMTAKRVLQPGGLSMLFGNIKVLPEMIDILQKHLNYTCIIPSINHPEKTWQPILVYSKEHYNGPVINIIDRKKQFKKLCESEYMDQVIATLINIYTNPDDTVLDPLMETGATGITALLLNRKFIGIEADPEKYGAAKRKIYDLKK